MCVRSGHPSYCSLFFFFQAEDGIRDLVRSRGLGDVYKRQGHDYVDFVKGHGRVWLVNRNFGNYSLPPQINHEEFERHGKLKKVGMETLFTQDYSFLALNITEFTPDPAGIMNETELFSKEVK